MEGKYYYADYGDNQAKEVLSKSRKVLHVLENEFDYVDTVITEPIVKNKLSLHHVLASYPEIKIFERTIRYWIEKGYTSVKSYYLPRKVRFPSKKTIRKGL